MEYEVDGFSNYCFLHKKVLDFSSRGDWGKMTSVLIFQFLPRWQHQPGTIMRPSNGPYVKQYYRGAEIATFVLVVKLWLFTASML